MSDARSIKSDPCLEAKESTVEFVASQANGKANAPEDTLVNDQRSSVTDDFHFSLSEASTADHPFPSIPGYVIHDVLGRGGMGVVYRATQSQLRRPVALKMVLSSLHATPQMRQRFLNEAEAIARLQHPGIVQVHDYGTTTDGNPYFALEFVSGGSLHRRLAEGPLAPRDAAHLVSRIAAAIHVAHQEGIVHRDLKPANVLLTRQGDPKVADFGLAKTDGNDLTTTGAVVGTPSYMAPEQASGQAKSVGPAADIYALGAILYECLTSRPPFRAATPLQTVHQVLTEEPVQVRTLQPQVPADLETLCHRCLQKELRRRFPSALELSAELERFLEGKPILSRPVGWWERTYRWCARNKLVAFISLGLATSVLLGVVAALVLSVWALRERDLAVSVSSQFQSSLDRYYAVTTQFDSQFNENPQLMQIRLQLSLAMVEEFHKLIAMNRGNAGLFNSLAQAYVRLGDIYSDLGDVKNTISCTDNSLKFQEEAISLDPENPIYLRQAAREETNAVANEIYHSTKREFPILKERLNRATARAEAALRIITQGTRHFTPTDKDYWHILVGCHTRSGQIEQLQGRYQATLGHYQASLAVHQIMRANGVEDFLPDMARLLGDTALVESYLKRWDDARLHVQEGVNLARALAAKHHGARTVRESLPVLLHAQAEIEAAAGNQETAVNAATEASRLFLELAQQFSNIPNYRKRFVENHSFLAKLQPNRTANPGTSPLFLKWLLSQGHAATVSRDAKLVVEHAKLVRLLLPDLVPGDRELIVLDCIKRMEEPPSTPDSWPHAAGLYLMVYSKEKPRSKLGEDEVRAFKQRGTLTAARKLMTEGKYQEVLVLLDGIFAQRSTKPEVILEACQVYAALMEKTSTQEDLHSKVKNRYLGSLCRARHYHAFEQKANAETLRKDSRFDGIRNEALFRDLVASLSK